MIKSLREFLEEVAEILEDGDTKVKIIIGNEESTLKDGLKQDRMATVLKLLESLSNDFSNSIESVMSAINGAVKGADIIGLKVEMVEDINALFDQISEDEKIQLKIVEK